MLLVEVFGENVVKPVGPTVNLVASAF